MNAELEKIAHVYGDVCVVTKKERRKRRKLLVIDLLFDYAKNSTLHGLRYIVARGLTITERLFWCVTVIASVVICSIYINNAYQKWVTSPVIVTVNGRLSSVSAVPFPSVTICPEVKVKGDIYNYTEAYELFLPQLKYTVEKSEEANLTRFRNIGTMCEMNYGLFHSRETLTDVSYVDDITEVAPTIDDILKYCSWYLDRNLKCSDLFSKVYTEDGVCYTANSLAANELFTDAIQKDYQYLDSNHSSNGWSPDNGYNYSVKDPYPRRGRIPGKDPDLQVFLEQPMKHRDKKCHTVNAGFKVYLNHPADLPQGSIYSYTARSDRVISMAISFNQLDTDPSLSSYSPEVRQCYFPSERPLRYFKFYTAKNCQAECLTNYTLEVCGCVGFYMPHSNSTEICAPSQTYCLSAAKDIMAQSEFNSDEEIKPEECRCLPTCNTIEYDAEILTSAYLYKNLYKKKPKMIFSKIMVFFKKNEFVTMQRRELFGVTELLANIGGLLGVFLGFSFLSLIELFYFLTLRVGFALKRDSEEEKLKKMSRLKGDKAK